MKHIILIFLLFSASVFCKAQFPGIQWENAYGGSGDEFGHHIEQTSDGGYVTCGYSTTNTGDVTNNFGEYDFWVVKMNGTGVIQWSKSYGSPGTDIAYSIKQTSDNGYIVTGWTDSIGGQVTINNGGQDIWVLKLDAAGTMQWQKSFGGTNGDGAEDIIQSSDGGYVIAGSSWSNDGDVIGNHGNLDFWILKLDVAGNLVWQKSLGGSGYDHSSSICETVDGGFIVAGVTGSNDGNVAGNHGALDYWIVKLDINGNLIWRRCIGGTNSEWAASIIQTSDAGFIVAGYSRSDDGNASANYGANDYWLTKLNLGGVVQWEKNYGGSWDDICYSMDTTNDGGYILSGYTTSNDSDIVGYHGNYDYWLVKADSLGVLQWQRSLGGSDGEEGQCVRHTNDGGYILCGYSTSLNGDVTGAHGSYFDNWVVKTSPFVGIEEEQNYPTLNVYPNPNYGEFYIGGMDGKNEIKIYDLMGQIIYQNKIEGNYYQINLKDKAKGIYMYEVWNEAKNKSYKGKVVVQ